ADVSGRVNLLFIDRLIREAAVSAVPGAFEFGSPLVSTSLQHGPDGRVIDTAYDWNVHPQRIRLAADLVRFEPADQPIVEHLLGKTVIVDDLGVARELHRVGPRGYRYVTHGGEVVEADGTLRVGPLTAAMGLLSRRSELEAVAAQIAEVDFRIET